MIEKLLSSRPVLAVVVIFVIALASITSAWGFEVIGGFKPCALCLMQRWAYYTAVPLALIVILAVWSGKISGSAVGWVAGLLGLVMLAGGALGAYHAGVEWGFWPGPSSCTGGGELSGGLPDLSKKVVMCDEVQIRIFGLSFAGWNVVVSAFCAGVGFYGFSTRKRD